MDMTVDAVAVPPHAGVYEIHLTAHGPRAEGGTGAPVTVALTGFCGALMVGLATRVSIQMGAKRGKVVIEFGSPDDLERIVSKIIGSGPGLAPD